MSVEDGRIFTPKAMVAVIEKMTGCHPDLFEPAQIATLHNEIAVKSILAGDTPGFISLDEKSGEAYFLPTYTSDQLQIVRENLAREFGVEIPNTEIIGQRFKINLGPHNKIEESLVGKAGNVGIRRETFKISKEDVEQVGDTFEDTFGFTPDVKAE